MKLIQGIYWPDIVTTEWRHSLRHARSIEWAIKNCARRRMAVQAGGNVGLWPLRLAKAFDLVLTFEPEPVTRECLIENTKAVRNIVCSEFALGAGGGKCRIKRRGLGSGRVMPGDDCKMISLDELGLKIIDLIAFDVEGYELHALQGAANTIDRCSPMIQVEVRGDEVKYGHNESDVRAFLGALGYAEVSRQPGPDVVFAR